jgi:hypothetical protein
MESTKRLLSWALFMKINIVQLSVAKQLKQFFYAYLSSVGIFFYGSNWQIVSDRCTEGQNWRYPANQGGGGTADNGEVSAWLELPFERNRGQSAYPGWNKGSATWGSDWAAQIFFCKIF